METSASISLAAHSSMETLFGDALKKFGPQDICEFTNQSLQWLSSPSSSMAWERRFSTDAGIELYDQGHQHQPITLDHACELDQEKYTFTELFQPWHKGVGMTSACLYPHGPKCWYVDRNIDAACVLIHFVHLDLNTEVLGRVWRSHTTLTWWWHASRTWARP